MNPTDKRLAQATEFFRQAHMQFYVIQPYLNAFPATYSIQQLRWLERQCAVLSNLATKGEKLMPSPNLMANYVNAVASDYDRFETEIRPSLHPSVSRDQWVGLVHNMTAQHFEGFAHWKRIGNIYRLVARAACYNFVFMARRREWSAIQDRQSRVNTGYAGIAFLLTIWVWLSMTALQLGSTPLWVVVCAGPPALLGLVHYLKSTNFKIGRDFDRLAARQRRTLAKFNKLRARSAEERDNPGSTLA